MGGLSGGGGGGVLTKLATIDLTVAAASLSFESLIDGSFDFYIAKFFNLVPVAASDDLRLRVLTNSILRTASYSGGGNTKIGVEPGVITHLQMNELGDVNQGINNIDGCFCEVEFGNPDSTTQHKPIKTRLSHSTDSDVGGNTWDGGGIYTGDLNALTGIQLSWSSGSNFQAGAKAVLYGGKI